MNKKVTTKTVQITKPELVKCRASQEFTANVITFTKPNPPPPGMPKWFKEWSYTFEKGNNSRFDRIETRLSSIETDVSELKTDVSKLDTKLTRVIKLNKLKS